MMSMPKTVSPAFFFSSRMLIFFVCDLFIVNKKNGCKSLDGVIILAEHLKPLLDNIAKLEEALYNIQFEQHWIEAQTERQAIRTTLTNSTFLLILYILIVLKRRLKILVH